MKPLSSLNLSNTFFFYILLGHRYVYAWLSYVLLRLTSLSGRFVLSTWPVDVDGGGLDDLGAGDRQAARQARWLVRGRGSRPHRRPSRAFCSNQFRRSRRVTTLPTMMTEGLVKNPALTPFLVERPRGWTARPRRFAVVPQRTRPPRVSGEGPASMQALPGHVGKVLHAHDEHERVRAGGEGLPVVDGAGLIGVFVSGDDALRTRQKLAVRQGDARVGRARATVLEMPGTSSNGTPASSSSSASSPPRRRCRGRRP